MSDVYYYKGASRKIHRIYRGKKDTTSRTQARLLQRNMKKEPERSGGAAARRSLAAAGLPLFFILFSSFYFLFSVPLASASIVLGHANTTALSQGLVGYWPMDGYSINWGTNFMSDTSGQGNNCNLISMPTSTSPIPGKIGQALKFNSSSSWCQNSISQHPTLDIPGDITISAWIYSTSAVANQDIVRAGQSTDDRYSLFYDGINKRIQFFWYDGSTFPSVSSNSNTVPLNQWVHVVGVRSGSTITLYANGVVVGTGAFTSAPITPVSFTIGGTITTGQPFKGSIDDLRIYNRALSAQKVALLYALGTVNAGHSPSTSSGQANTGLNSGLVGYWPLDGATTNWSKNTTSDLSGQGNTGTLISMSTTTSPVPGKIGQALSFNSSGQITFGTNVSTFQFGTGSFSISAWFTSTSSALGGTPAIWGVTLGANGSRYGLEYIGGSPAAVQAFIKDDAGNSVATFNSLTPIANNRWYHAVMVVNRQTNIMSVYINGVFDNSKSISTVTGNINPQGTALARGLVGGVSAAFGGNIDDIRVYNKALSAQEVAQLYALGTANVSHSNSSPSTGLNSGLVGYWTFDGPSINWATGVVKDLSGQGNNSQTVGMGTSTSPVVGKIGQALKFNGSSTQVSSVNNISLTSGAVTISAWVKRPWNTIKAADILHVTLAQFSGIALSATNGSNTGVNGQKDITCVGNGFQAGNAPQAFAIPPTFVDNTWHHIVCVLGPSTAQIYADGVALSMRNSSVAGSLPSITNKVFIGGELSFSDIMDGSIDDVRIYNRALSAQEIAQLYSLGK